MLLLAGPVGVGASPQSMTFDLWHTRSFSSVKHSHGREVVSVELHPHRKQVVFSVSCIVILALWIVSQNFLEKCCCLCPGPYSEYVKCTLLVLAATPLQQTLLNGHGLSLSFVLLCWWCYTYTNWCSPEIQLYWPWPLFRGWESHLAIYMCYS